MNTAQSQPTLFEGYRSTLEDSISLSLMSLAEYGQLITQALLVGKDTL